MVTSGVCCLAPVHTPEEAQPTMTTDQPHTGPESPEQSPAAVPDSANARVAVPGVQPPERGSVGITSLLITVLTVVAGLLVLIVFPIWDGMKGRGGDWETFSELHSMSSAAAWKIDSEISSTQWSVDGELYSLDSGLWSLGSDVGSLAYDVGADSRPRVRELEDAIDARRAELRGLRRSADAQFDQLRDSVAARLGELEDATGAAQDDDRDVSSRKYDRDMRIIMGWLWSMLAVLLASGLVGLWVSWRDYRALAKSAGGM